LRTANDRASVSATYRIEDDVDIGNHRFEWAARHIDDAVGAKCADIVDVPRKRGRDDLVCDIAGHLHSIGAHVAGAAMHRVVASTRACSNSICQAVLATTGTAAASTKPSVAGLRASIVAVATAYSAQAPTNAGFVTP
jgi:hypothetical protein